MDRHRALEKTLAKIRLDDKPEDSDDDVFEFEDAKVEETEDKLVLEFNKKQDFLSKEEIEMITQEVSELDISRDILMMVSRRHMSKNNLKTINEVAEDREESESLSNISQNEIDEKNRKTGLKMMFAQTAAEQSSALSTTEFGKKPALGQI